MTVIKIYIEKCYTREIMTWGEKKEVRLTSRREDEETSVEADERCRLPFRK